MKATADTVPVARSNLIERRVSGAAKAVPIARPGTSPYWR
jgi:hypothetical protein